MTLHEDYIGRCLELALIAVKAGNGPFGSLIVVDGKLISESYNKVRTNRDISAHAEIDAIRGACQALGTLDLSTGIIYTSAEPCFMCSYAIRMSHISQVIIGARALDRGGVSSKYPILMDPNIEGMSPPPDIVRDILLDDCTALLHEHGFHHI